MGENRSRSVGYRFGMLFRLNQHFLNEALKPIGLRAGQVACLAELLHSDGPRTQEDISTSLAIDPAATARTVDLLVRKGLAVRTVNPENRRQNLVSATPTARDAAKDFFETLKGAEDNFAGDLTDEERQTLIRLMDRMIYHAKKRKYAQHQ